MAACKVAICIRIRLVLLLRSKENITTNAKPYMDIPVGTPNIKLKLIMYENNVFANSRVLS